MTWTVGPTRARPDRPTQTERTAPMATTEEELDQLADQFELDSREASDRVRDHLDFNNQTGANIATVTAEIYEAAAERLRTRAQELRDGAE